MKTFRVHFTDSNQRLYEAENMAAILNYLLYLEDYSANDIWKIEEVEK